jgi:hypothetical protein
MIDERDKVLGHGRDLAELQRTLGAREAGLGHGAARAL